MNRLAMVMVAFASIFVATAHAQVEIKYNRFQNRTEITGHAPPVLDGPNITFSTMYPGQHPASDPDYVIIGYLFTTKEGRYLQCHHVAFLADGKPIKVERSLYNVTPSGSYFIEGIGAFVPFEEARVMASAKLIESQVCNTEVPFAKVDLENLRGVINAASSHTWLPDWLPTWLRDWFR